MFRELHVISIFSENQAKNINILTANNLVLNLQSLLQDCAGDTSLTMQVTEHRPHSDQMAIFLQAGIARLRENCFLKQQQKESQS